MQPDQETKPTFDTSDIGCYFDCSRGIYIGVELQKLAKDYGWKPDPKIMTGNPSIPLQPNHNLYHELITEAIEYLQALTLDGLWWGYSESGDFGLWLVDCDKCGGWGGWDNSKDICPSCKGTGNELQIKI